MARNTLAQEIGCSMLEAWCEVHSPTGVCETCPFYDSCYNSTQDYE